MTNDTYISGLGPINKHAEQLSILRGIDRCGLTCVEKRLVALFGGRAGRGERGKRRRLAHLFLNHDKPPTSANTPGLASLRKPHKEHGLVLTVAPAHVYMAVVCRYELMGGDTNPNPHPTHTHTHIPTHPPFGRMGAADR